MPRKPPRIPPAIHQAIYRVQAACAAAVASQQIDDLPAYLEEVAVGEFHDLGRYGELTVRQTLRAMDEVTKAMNAVFTTLCVAVADGAAFRRAHTKRMGRPPKRPRTRRRPPAAPAKGKAR